MNELPLASTSGACDLDMIVTQWLELHDNNQFLKRYERAVLRYLEALLKNRQDAEDVAQSFFLRIVERGFERVDPERGRFRDYLKTGVRNAAISFLRHKRRQPPTRDVAEEMWRDDSDTGQRWLQEWQSCLLDRAWEALERHQQFSDGNLYHTVLRVTVDFPDEDSVALAGRVSTLARRPLSPEAFRKQLSRARRLFAQMLVREVAQTLHQPSDADIEEELRETGLGEYVRRYE